MNDILKVVLMEKKPIRMESSTIVEYCLGTLDAQNSWVLDHGDIKVVPSRFETETKIKENEDE
jgi:hypothetical protein